MAARNCSVSALFQSTRPRGARHCGVEVRLGGVAVSIHAPAWGATSQLSPRVETRLVSIHAPAWGATHQRACQDGNVRVSIHAPAWGATGSDRPWTGCRGRFNPRARVGRDGRRWARRCRSRCFNPRARVGRDHHVGELLDAARVSIHAPAWGATHQRACQDGNVRVSIHAPAWGATPAPHPVRHVLRVSIHAPAWGATRSPRCRSMPTACFNPRARVGRDRSA